MSFDAIIKTMKDSAKKDPHSSVRSVGDITLGSTVPYGIPSGIPRLDFGIGRPGLPVGRVIEFFGFEMSGKTTAALHALAQAQRMGGGGIFIDAEYSWDDERAEAIGVDIDKNFQPVEVDTIEAIFRQMDWAIKGVNSSGFNKPFVIIVDSVTAVPTEGEREKEHGAVARIGEDARVIRNGMRKIMPDIAKSNVCVIFINHAVATNITGPAFAKKSDSSGGHAIKFFAAVRCEFKNAGMIKNGDEKLGQKINMTLQKIKKSKLRFPEIKDVALMVDNGFDLTIELLEAGIRSGMVSHSKGSKSYTLGDREFPRSDWPQIIEDMGGPNKVYSGWLNWCQENGVMRPWDAVEYE